MEIVMWPIINDGEQPMENVLRFETIFAPPMATCDLRAAFPQDDLAGRLSQGLVTPLLDDGRIVGYISPKSAILDKMGEIHEETWSEFRFDPDHALACGYHNGVLHEIRDPHGRVPNFFVVPVTNLD